MTHFLKISFVFLLVFSGLQYSNAQGTYPNEVRQSGNSYVWRINNIDMGTTNSLATAINNCIGSGNRVVHLLTGGTLTSTIDLRPGLTIYGHNNIFNSGHSGHGFYIEGSGPIKMYDLVFNNYGGGFGIRTTRAGDLDFENITIRGGGIGLRIDSHPSRPYEDGRWVYNVRVVNCTFENTGGHGLETYGVDGFFADGIVARNTGGCGVLLNKTNNGTLGTIDSYRCNFGGGYAGLRFANNCSNITVDMLYADECGRGYFVLTGSNNIVLKNCQISNSTDVDIWLENVVNCSVLAGCVNSGVRITAGTNLFANVQSCNYGSSNEGVVQIRNIETDMFLDGQNRDMSGSVAAQSANQDSDASHWLMIRKGEHYQFRNTKTGLYLDGKGLTEDGSDVFQNVNTIKLHTYWSVQHQSGNRVRFQNVETGLYLDGMLRSADGSAVGQSVAENGSGQLWGIIPVSYNVQIQNRSTDMVFDGMGRLESGTNCGQWGNTVHLNTQWIYSKTADGYARFQNRRSALYVDGLGRTTLGAALGQSSNPSGLNAQWELIPATDDFVFIRNRGTGMYIDGMGRRTNGNDVGQRANLIETYLPLHWKINPMSQLLSNITTSVQETQIGANSQVSVFPNPIIDRATIRLAEAVNNASVQVFDISGKMVFSASISGMETDLDLSILQSGLYVMQVIGSNFTSNQIIVKE